MAWSLENEICQLSKKTDISEALLDLGLIANKTLKFQIRQIGKWTRGGAETYIQHFSIHTDEGVDRYVVKACTPSNISRNIEDVLSNWVERRVAISSSGISTPKLYAADNGVILEEYIPYSLREIMLKNPQGVIRKSLVSQIGDTLNILESLGFNSITSLHDLRSRGEDVTVIDFGQDLGTQSKLMNHPESTNGSRLLSTIGARLSNPEKRHALSMHFTSPHNRNRLN